MFNSLHILILLSLANACTSKIEVRGEENKKNIEGSNQELLPFIKNIEMDQGKLKIVGKNLNKISTMKLQAKDLDTSLKFSLNETGEQLLAEAGSSIFLVLNKLFSLVVTDAYGQEKSYAVTFKLGKGSVTAEMLSSMNASDGDVLVYNAVKKSWETKALNGLKYKGVWDFSSKSAPSEDPEAGDYWIVKKAAKFTLNSIDEWGVGDWIIFNGQEWQKIKNSNEVLSFKGRKGIIIPEANDYTWEQIEKSTSKLDDIADVDLTGISENQVLTWDGSKWIAASVPTSGSGSVANISDSQIATNASIAQSKIQGLSTSLAAKQNVITTGTTGQYLKGDLSLGTFADEARSAVVVNGITNGATTTSPSEDAVFDALASKQNAIVPGTPTQYLKGDLTLGTLDTSAVSENNNLYFTNDRARTAAVADAITNGTTNIAPSQNAVFDALALKGDLKSDGTVATSSLKFKDSGANFITVKAPNTVGSSFEFILPASAGVQGQVLKMGANNELIWATDETTTAGSVTTTAILDGTISNSDIANDAAISQSKIDGLSSSLAAKQNVITTGTTGQYLKGDLSLGTFADDAKSAVVVNGITNGATTTSPSEDAVFDALALKQNAITTGVTTEYFRGDLSRADFATDVKLVAVADAIADNVTDKAPSQNAVHDALVGKLNATGGTLSGDLNLGANQLKLKDGDSHLISLKAPTDVVADFSLILPTTAGTNGQVLATDGNGNLSWNTILVSGTGTVDTTNILNDTIVDADINPAAAIAQSKIANLTTDLASKQSSHANLSKLSSATLNNNQYLAVDNSGNIVSRSATNIKTDLALAKGDVGLGNVDNIQQMPLSYLNTDTALGTSDVLVPSQNAVKTYADSKISGLTSATDNALVRFDGTTGKLVQNSLVTLDDNGYFFKNGVLFLHNFNYGDNGTVTTSGRNLFVGENVGNLTMGSTVTNVSHASDNVLVGFQNGRFITSGFRNASIGSNSGYNLTTGSGNSFMGHQAGYSLSTGTGNVFIGGEAGNNSTTSNYNSFIGAAAGRQNTTGLNNSYFGAEAGRNVTSGNNNTYLGYQAGRYYSSNPIDANVALTRNNSIMIGYRSRSLLDNSTNETVIGHDAIGFGANTVTIGNDSVTDTYLKGNIRLKDSDGTANFVAIKAPSALVSDLTMIFPNTAGTSGQVLKTDGAGNLSWGDSIGTSSVGADAIVDGSIANADISATAAIEQSKIANLTSDLAAKQALNSNLTNLSSATLTNNQYLAIDNVGSIVSKSTANVKTDLALVKDDVGLGSVDNVQQMPMTYLSTTTTLGTNDNMVPTQNAVKTYVDTADALKANKADVLEKTNTTSFTPTTDFHPATKKYVDDQNVLAGTIAERISGDCDGRTIIVRSGSYTLANVTATQTFTTTYSDITASVISYTPPAGTKVVEYEFAVHFGQVDSAGLGHIKFFFDGTEVTAKRTTIRVADGAINYIFKGSIHINGVDDLAKGKVATWTTPKIMKLQFRNYTNLYEVKAHETFHWDGGAGNQLSIPNLTITSIY